MESDIKILSSCVHVGVDVHFKEGSWAVVCIDSKPELVKFYTADKADMREILDFLRRWEKCHTIVDANPAFKQMLKMY